MPNPEGIKETVELKKETEEKKEISKFITDVQLEHILKVNNAEIKNFILETLNDIKKQNINSENKPTEIKIEKKLDF